VQEFVVIILKYGGEGRQRSGRPNTSDLGLDGRVIIKTILNKFILKMCIVWK
jgi:hypothetical protein